MVKFVGVRRRQVPAADIKALTLQGLGAFAVGHEFLGTVEDVGSQVTRFRRGDRVLASCTVDCGSCASCQRGLWSGCSTQSALGPASMVFGMSPALQFETSFMLLPLITLVYVTAITALSKFEVQGGLGRRGIPVLMGWSGVIFLVLWLKIHADLHSGIQVG